MVKIECMNANSNYKNEDNVMENLDNNTNQH